MAVIVQVYNAEDYLRQCIDSILGQTYRDLKLILVNDQSTDSSGLICDNYARQDRRVCVTHQKNVGPAGARNTALNQVGDQKYVMFVDADDYLAPNAVERCISAIATHQSDMVICNFTTVPEDKDESVQNAMELTGLLQLDNLIQFIDGSNDLLKSAFMGPAWRRLLKYRIIRDHNLRFPDGEYLAEDIVFMAQYFKKCRSFYALDEPLYFKRQHSRNLSIGFEGVAIKPMMLGYEAYKILLSDAPAEDNLRLDRQFRNEMIGSIVRMHHPRLKLSGDEKSSRIALIVNAPAFRSVLKGYKIEEGHSRLLAMSIKLRCIPLIKLIAGARAKKRYRGE